MSNQPFLYRPTTALTKISKVVKQNDLAIIQGGQGAGKTISILMLLISYCWRFDKKEVTICSSELSKLKGTAINDFVKILKDWNMFKLSDWNKSEMVYRFPNGSFIEFIGLDKTDVGKGRRRDFVFINETNKVNLQSFTDITARAKKVICDFNPDAYFYLHDLKTQNNFISLTYKDNNFLSQKEINNILEYYNRGYFPDGSIKNSYWANKWKVFGLGEVGMLDGVIFNNYQIIKEIPTDARLIGYGVDFGYSNDPTAIVEVYQYNGQRILNEICYQKELSNSQIAKYINSKLPCYCDSAEPKSIAELKHFGVNAKGVTKGKDSINFGIQIMQEQDYLVTENSKNIINELSRYTWATDKRTGEKLNIPIDDYNHIIDAIRYHEMESIGIKKVVTISGGSTTSYIR
jgi:phage terminase large subunit